MAMTRQLGDIVLGNADVVVDDETGAITGGENVLVPAHDTDTRLMAMHAAELGTILDIPDLDLAIVETRSDVGAIAAPLD